MWGAMSKLLGVSSRELEGFLRERSDRQFVYLKRQIDPDEAKRFIALGAPGVFSQREYRRYYPAGESPPTWSASATSTARPGRHRGGAGHGDARHPGSPPGDPRPRRPRHRGHRRLHQASRARNSTDADLRLQYLAYSS